MILYLGFPIVSFIVSVEKQWSPEQISGYLAKEGKRISTESI